MRDLFLLLVFGTYLGLGMTAPFVATLGYLWVDLAAPQAMAHSFLRSISVSMIMGAAAVFFYVAFEKKQNVKPSLPQVLLLVLAAWVTLTSTWAVVPDAAWWKWDWAIKTLLFAFFAPYIINTRARFEAFVLTFILAIAVNYLPLATKTILTGGGYGKAHTVLAGNSKLAESSTLAMASIMALPLLYALYKHNTLFRKSRLTLILMLFFGSFAVIAMFGTYARTGLACLAIFAVLLVLQTRRKVTILATASVVMLLSFNFLPPEWQSRMNTIRTPTQDTSASVRLSVWQWTYDFTKQNPLGGGFEAYRVNKITLTKPAKLFSGEDPKVTVQHGRAFHSMYFEVLGEHGWPGLVIFLGLLAATFAKLRAVYVATRDTPKLLWLNNYAVAVSHLVIILLVGGAFIGIAFQAISLFAISLAIMLDKTHKTTTQAHPVLTHKVASL